MKKFLGLGLTLALATSALALPATATASATDNSSAVETIKPMAVYTFDDSTNPGKDTSGNGYDLTKLVTYTDAGVDALQILEDNGDNYAKFTSKRDADGHALNQGACLYAPELSGGKDFSDLIEESYTVSITLRRDNSTWIGDHYTLAVGRYNNAFQITPWKGGVEIQVNNMSMAPGATQDEKGKWLESSTYLAPCNTSNWTNVIVSTDAATNVATVYVNGQKVTEITMTDTYFSYREDNYAFTLGAQCQINGNASIMYATVDIADCRVYDCALSADNVAKLYAGEEAVVDQDVYITDVAAIDTSELDLLVTDQNTVDVVMGEVLPQKTMVTLSSGGQMPAKIAWYPVPGSTSQIRGYIQSAYANVKQLALTVDYSYTARFTYDDTLVRVSQVKLDNNAYEAGTAITPAAHSLTFKVEPLNDFVNIDSVSYMDMEWEPEEGVYYLTVSKGADIIIEASTKKGTITYMDGEEKLGTSKYSYGGSETLKEYEKEGYVFVGWYTDAECKNAFSALDYQNPVDITLYAKYKKEGGCSSTIGLTSGIAMLGAAACVLFKKRK